jgi:acyl transferase domain-containing protein
MEATIANRCRFGGFMAGISGFDTGRFFVSPAEAAAMDPQQRLLLERGYESLHDASLNRHSLSGSLTGVFLGIAAGDFGLVLGTTPAGSSVYAATGSSHSIACGRVSYVLGLHGPCASYDTACSAALTAYHASLRALQLDECSDGLAAGINLMLTPNNGTAFAISGLTSLVGRSHTFDLRADGYARGEACCAAAMRQADGTRSSSSIFALGSMVRQDGRSASLTAPNGQAQQGLLASALQDAGVAADALTTNEAHGTGTALGDPIETRSLIGAVIRPRAQDTELPIGGVKANIGHAEPAAGMTGLIKLALGLQDSKSASNAQLRLLNPHVGSALQGMACALPVQLATALVGSGGGGVSSFGYSGTIAHAVLRHAGGDGVTATVLPPLVYRRHAFPWRESPHPFVQRLVPSSDDDSRSCAKGCGWSR